MPQSSPGQGRGMPPGSISRGFQGILSIGNMLVFTTIFDVYDTYGAEVSDHDVLTNGTLAFLSIMGVLPSSPWLHFQNEGVSLEWVNTENNKIMMYIT